MTGRRAGVYVEGLRELRRAVMEAGGDLPARMKEAAKDAAEVVAEAGRRYAPFRSGALRGSIRTGVSGTKALVRVGNAKVPYAKVIEFGWPAHNIEPNEFMANALESKSDVVEQTFLRRLDDLLNDVAP